MSLAELREEIAIEMENLDLTARELRALRQDVQGREPTVREKTAAAAFLLKQFKDRLGDYLQTSPGPEGTGQT